MKTCNTCDTPKPETDFPWHRKGVRHAHQGPTRRERAGFAVTLTAAHQQGDTVLTDVIETPQAFARYARRKPLEQYGYEEASLSLPVPVVDGKVDSEAYWSALAEAKAQVLDNLGLDVIVSAGPPPAVVTPALTTAALAASLGAEQVAPPASPAVQAPAAAGGVMPRVIKPSAVGPLEAWLPEQFAKAQNRKDPSKNVDPNEGFWDNRPSLPQNNGKGKATQPWYKGADTGNGIWPPD